MVLAGANRNVLFKIFRKYYYEAELECFPNWTWRGGRIVYMKTFYV